MKTADIKVEVVDFMGSDINVVNAARVSFHKESEAVPVVEGDQLTFTCNEADTKLINYLAKHNHWTPFAHTAVTLRIKAPIFVARQLGKHQIGLVWNEVSRRYVSDEPEFFFPETWRKRADNVKQGSSEESVKFSMLDPTSSTLCALTDYNEMLREGVCPEQARMVLPQNMMTEWVWTGNVASFARVCKLRLDPHTQKETRYTAGLISNEMEKLFPISWKALVGPQEQVS